MTTEDQRVQANLRAMLERNLRMRGLGKSHIERIMRLNKSWQPGREIRGLRLWKNAITSAAMFGLVTKGYIIRRFGRDAWELLEMADRMCGPQLVVKHGRRKYATQQALAELQQVEAIHAR